MGKLTTIIGKNMRIFFRSKLSALAILLAPLLLVFLVGNAFNSSAVYGVNIGVYSESYSTLSESIIDNLGQKTFIVEKFDSQENCQDSVKKTNTQMCIIFPGELSPQGNTDSIKIYVDNSRANIAHAVVNDINDEIGERSSEISIVLAQDLIGAVEQAKSTLPQSKQELENVMAKANSIQSDSQQISSININSTISILEDAKETISNSNLSSSQKSSLESEIDDAISDLSDSSSTLSGNVANIEQNIGEARETLTEISANLDSLINGINGVTSTTAENVASPIKTEINSIATENNWNSLLPILLALVVLFASTILSSTLVLKERKTKAFFRNFITPTKDITFLIGIYISVILILAMQFALLFIAARWITNLDIIPQLLNISVVLLLSASAFIFLGIFIGYSFKSEETAILASIIIASILMFFSNAILPIETISGNFRLIAQFNPLVLATTTLNKLMLFGSTLKDFTFNLLVLGGEIIVLFLFSITAIKVTKRSA